MTKWRRERPRKVRSFGNPACSFSKPRIARRLRRARRVSRKASVQLRELKLAERENELSECAPA